MQGVLAHAAVQSSGDRHQKTGRKFKIILSYIVSPGPAWDTCNHLKIVNNRLARWLSR